MQASTHHQDQFMEGMALRRHAPAGVRLHASDAMVLYV
jgi:hypothetical protein